MTQETQDDLHRVCLMTQRQVNDAYEAMAMMQQCIEQLTKAMSVLLDGLPSHGEPTHDPIIPAQVTEHNQSGVGGEIPASTPEGFNIEKARKDLKPEAWELLKQPVVQSLLYDINLLPEQITTGQHWFYMLSVLLHMDHAMRTAKDTPMKWQPIETAPKDGTRVLVKFKDDLSEYDGHKDGSLKIWQGIPFVARNRNDLSLWGFGAPVGHGGFPDVWLEGWQPITSEASALPAPPESEAL